VIQLNREQQKAVDTTEGPVLIVAGAGAGKTKTITERIVHIIQKGVEPSSILAITFTNKAANEMKERVIVRLASVGLNDGPMPIVKTFHSFGAWLLREHASLFGLTRHSPILDESDVLTIIKNVCERLGLDIKQYDPKRMMYAISRAKGESLSVHEYREKAVGIMQDTVAKVWNIYEEELRAQKSLDFDDLLVRPLRMLEENETFRTFYQKRFSHIHVDEYQDTNETQYKLTKILAAGHKNICVVGDSDQNIYSWRGANLKNLLHFEIDFPNATVILLEQNYRSTDVVLQAANAVIEKNKVRTPKVLRTDKTGGDTITIIQNWDENIEAHSIASKAGELIARGVHPKEIAVLFRTNFQSRVLEQGFMESGVPYKMVGTRFFDRKEIRDIVSWIRFAYVRESNADFKRAVSTPSRGIGKTTVLKILAKEELVGATARKVQEFYALVDGIKDFADTHTVVETLKHVLRITGYEDMLRTEGDDGVERLLNIEELVSYAVRYNDVLGEAGIERFFEEVSLLTDKENATEENTVRLMTIHASKGLEFEYVFIAGLEQDLFPSRRGDVSKQTREELEEERRLMYVALTRAKKKLFLTYAELRTIFGSKQINAPSEFISDIPGHLIEMEMGERDGGGTVVYL